MEKQRQHGGKRVGAGRKPKPANERRDRVFAVKLTNAEKRLLDEAKAKNWARDTLLATAKRKLK